MGGGHSLVTAALISSGGSRSFVKIVMSALWLVTLYDESIMINDNVMINKYSDSSIINPLLTPIDPQIVGDGDSDLHVTS